MDETEIERAARMRATAKLIVDAPREGDGLPRETVEALVAAAGMAPFHRPGAAAREGEGAPEPWRVAMLDAPACRAAARALPGWGAKQGKLGGMLDAADALLLVTWAPEPDHERKEEFDAEHLASAAAFCQTLLLAATARGIPSYWSSGGALGEAAAFDALGIAPGSRLAGALFLFPEDEAALPGKMRSLRRSPSEWSRWVTI